MAPRADQGRAAIIRDGDGLSDLVEGEEDTDSDGFPDYLSAGKVRGGVGCSIGPRDGSGGGAGWLLLGLALRIGMRRRQRGTVA